MKKQDHNQSRPDSDDRQKAGGKRNWITPKLERLGGEDDVSAGGFQVGDTAILLSGTGS